MQWMLKKVDNSELEKEQHHHLYWNILAAHNIDERRRTTFTFLQLLAEIIEAVWETP